MSLADADRRLLRLFLACVLGNWNEVRLLRAQAGPGEPDRRWRETVLQVHLFAGVPRQVEAAGILATAGGLGDPEPGEIEGALDVRARGAALFDRIYADDSGAVRAMLARGHPEFERWVLDHAYGSVLSRPGLAADRRELLAVVALAALGQERQLASHARGAVRCGSSREEVLEALEAVADLVGSDGAARLAGARRVIERLA
ncbi:MAG TPA: carboxymuconolactone decarboxylase family protein [Planctomycetota bacterium]|jgi:4-carboxymuconolactone decarboxylase|nr:carboxymuconolactone decarboxylase family protein [Planctomycetota bacterium]